MQTLRQAVVYALIPVAIVATSLSARESANHTPQSLSRERAPAASGDAPLPAVTEVGSADPDPPPTVAPAELQKHVRAFLSTLGGDPPPDRIRADEILPSAC